MVCHLLPFATVGYRVYELLFDTTQVCKQSV